MKENKQVICTDINGKKYGVDVDQLDFRPSVYGIIIQDGKVLLSKQWDGYDFPGGGVNLGERMKDALVREVKEETGFDIRIGHVVASEDSFFKLPYKNNFVHSILIYYICTIVGGKISKDFLDGYEKKYADMPEWISLSEIKNIKFYNSIDSIKILEKIETLSI